jgi:hypothetical protein
MSANRIRFRFLNEIIDPDRAPFDTVRAANKCAGGALASNIAFPHRRRHPR